VAESFLILELKNSKFSSGESSNDLSPLSAPKKVAVRKVSSLKSEKTGGISEEDKGSVFEYVRCQYNEGRFANLKGEILKKSVSGKALEDFFP
jgi:hypothetical protein